MQEKEKEIASPYPAVWAEQLMQAAREGWEVDVDSIARCPQFTGNMFFAVLVKKDEEDISTVQEDVVTEKPKRVPPQRRKTID